MAYEQVQKPSSSFVPVQKKVSEFSPSAHKVQAKDVTAGEQEQIPLGSTPATDANWLMKHPLFKGNQFLQREVAPASESESLESEEETLQRQEEGNEAATPYSITVQAKLTIGEPGDKYEQEADRVASQVVKQINSPEAAQSTQGQSVQRQEEPVEELQAKPSISDLQRSPLPLEVQREAMPAEEELQAKSILQRRAAIAGGEATNDLDTAINSARGSGQPLDAGLQRSMGQAMGADFSGVKVHTDAQSDQLNQSIQAKAFTTGQDVFFRQGAYDPGSRGGQELIAHELTHVVQQNGGAVQRSPSTPQQNQIQSIVGGAKVRSTIVQRVTLNIRPTTGANPGTISGVSNWTNRPPSNLSIQGQHLTAYVTFKQTILSRVRDRTPTQAAAELYQVVQEIRMLPYMNPPSQWNNHIHQSLNGIEQRLNQAATLPDQRQAARDVGYLIDAILTERNRVPSTAINEPGTVGHGEAGHAGSLEVMENTIRKGMAGGYGAPQAQQAVEEMWSLFDYDPPNPTTAKALLEIQRRVLTHVMSMRTAFPHVFAWLTAKSPKYWLMPYLRANRGAIGALQRLTDGYLQSVEDYVHDNL